VFYRPIGKKGEEREKKVEVFPLKGRGEKEAVGKLWGKTEKNQEGRNASEERSAHSSSQRLTIR